MFCPKCGNQNIEDAQFCQKCGNGLTVDKSGLSNLNNKSGRTKRVLIFITIYFLVIVTGIGLLLFSFYKMTLYPPVDPRTIMPYLIFPIILGGISELFIALASISILGTIVYYKFIKRTPVNRKVLKPQLIVFILSFITIFSISFAGGIAAYFILQNPLKQSLDNSLPAITPSVGSIASWETYRNEKIGFEIKHPQNIKPNEFKNGTEVYFDFYDYQETKATELYDGFMSSFNAMPLNGRTLNQVVAESIKAIQKRNEEGTGAFPIKILEYPKPITIAGLNGYTFQYYGNADTREYYLPLSQNQYLLFGLSLEDPKGRGYQKTVDQMLSTLKLIGHE